MSSEQTNAPDEIKALRMIVKAHGQPHPQTGDREPILFMRFLGGSQIHHHGLHDEELVLDEALINDMHGRGMVSVDLSGSGSTWQITPTPFGRQVADEAARVEGETPTADVVGVVAAINAQVGADNPLAWPAVRPVLVALHGYWQHSGYSEHGIGLLPIAKSVPEDQLPTFAATIRALDEGGYLAKGVLSHTLESDSGSAFKFPGEVALTEKARAVVDGWPGSAPSELVENLLAVLVRTAQDETDPVRRGRIESLIGAIKEVGVSVTAEVISKVVLGAL